MRRWAASFRDFAKPKTSLMSQTERGLTSEFGMGSGGSHALWPVTQLSSTAILFKRIGKHKLPRKKPFLPYLDKITLTEELGSLLWLIQTIPKVT